MRLLMDVENFKVVPNKGVEWGDVFIPFTGGIEAIFIHHRCEIVLIGDSRLHGIDNLFIYCKKGTLRLRPKIFIENMDLKGVYTMWYKKGDDLQTIILESDFYSPYDTACTLDLRTGDIGTCHPSK